MDLYPLRMISFPVYILFLPEREQREASAARGAKRLRVYIHNWQVHHRFGQLLRYEYYQQVGVNTTTLTGNTLSPFDTYKYSY